MPKDPRLARRPPNVNEALLDAGVRHLVGLQRYATGLRDRVLAILNQADADLDRRIRERYAAIAERGFDSGPATTARLEQIRKELRQVAAPHYAEATRVLVGDLRELAQHEAVQQVDALRSIIPVNLSYTLPASPELLAIADTFPLLGRTMKDWAEGLLDSQMQRVDDAVKIGLVEGDTIDQLARRVRGTAAAGYSDGILDVGRREAQAIVRTAVNGITSRARELTYAANADLVKGVQWVSTLDTRTTLICISRDGTVFQVDEGPRPPAHWNCLPGDAVVLARSRISRVYKRWFDGELVIVETASGRKLSCTPNHPVFTPAGFVPAGRLHVGGYVVADRFGQRKGVPNGDGQDVPARIEDVAEAFFASPQVLAGPVPMAAEDFHGDGEEGQVAIVGTNRLLRDGEEAASREHIGEAGFEVGRSARSVALEGGGHHLLFPFRFLPTANGIVCGRGKPQAFGRRGPIHPGLLLLAAVAQRDPGLAEDPHDRGRRAPEQLGDAADPDAAFEFPDQIVGVQRRDFSGHVYNLQTGTGRYTADGIITHNCRSTTVPVTVSYEELGVKAGPAPASTRASMNGQVPDSLTYGDWLRNQSAAVQDDALGPTRGKLFREGGLAVDRFVNDEGRTLTLDELRKRDAAAFKKAGV